MSMSKQARIAAILPNGKPRWIRCYDNGGLDAENGSTDRYTAVFTGRYRHKTGGETWYLAMSEHPSQPFGVGLSGSSQTIIDAQHGKWPPAIGRSNHLGKRIRFDDLPEECKRLVLDHYCYLWDVPDPNTGKVPEA